MRPTRSLSLTLLTALPLCLVCASVQAFVATVGPDGSGCDYTPASEPGQGDAIGLAITDGATEVRLVTDKWTEDVVVSRSLTIKGGYLNCTDAAADTQDATAISEIAPRAGRPIRVVGDGADGVSVTLDQIGFTDCDTQGTGAGFEGGGLKIENGATVLADTVTVRSCQATDGGGVHVSGGSTLLFDSGRVRSNQAVNGGGISCESSTDFMAAASALVMNQAVANDTNDIDQGNGGGLYATDCTVDIISRPIINPNAGLEQNTATNNGGGIFATNSTDLTIEGGVICRRADELGLDCGLIGSVRLLGNVADSDDDNAGDGGAIYARGLSVVEADATRFLNNSAYNGGAIAAFQARLRLGFAGYFFEAYDNCGVAPCVEFDSNAAKNRGGGIWADFFNELLVRFSDFKFNTADTGVALSLNRQFAGASVTINNSAIVANGDGDLATDDRGLIDLNLIQLSASDRFEVTALTVAQNIVNDGIFVSDDATQVDDVVMQGSLLQDSSPVLEAGLDGAFSGACVVTDSALPAGVSGIENTAVALENAEIGNYRPQAGSAALDVCTSAQMPGSAQDTDLTNGERPLVTRVFTSTPYDAGAVERPIEVQQIFGDRFEELVPVR